MQDAMVTTALSLPGYKIVRNLGVVRGLTVRSRSIIGNFFGGIQSIFGGNITIYTNLCEQAREETYRLMCEHAEKHGANAIIAVRYGGTDGGALLRHGSDRRARFKPSVNQHFSRLSCLLAGILFAGAVTARAAALPHRANAHGHRAGQGCVEIVRFEEACRPPSPRAAA
jgi:uncharacterized protein YbjQ (UPF0145 family)